MPSSADVHVPVLIVGGSLVGLSTSVFLGRLGVEHMVVERHENTSVHPRGRGNNVRTMELFRTAGIEAAIQEAAALLADNHGILQAKSLTSDDQRWLFTEMDPEGLLPRISPSNWNLCSQNDLEPVLVREAQKLGAEVHFNTELITFDQDDEGITAVVNDRRTGKQRTVRADYMVAADGPRSSVREQLGIERSGHGELFHNVSIMFRAPELAKAVGERRFVCCYLTNPESDGALLPVDNREVWVFHAPYRPGDGETLEDFTDERCTGLIRVATGVPDAQIEVMGKAEWHAAELVADRFQEGRVFLAGDSAHEMSPTGAFGANTGIQDAHNLAWKLAAVLKGHAGPGLLATYGVERRAVAISTSERASGRSAEHKHPGYDAKPGVGRMGDVLTVTFGYRYASDGTVGADPAEDAVPERMDLTAKPGTRAPHMWLRHGKTRLSTLDLFEQSLVLLSGDHSGWHEAAERIAEQARVPLRSYRVGPGPDHDLITEDGTDWAATHGTTVGGAVLVRPDGFVAWRSETAVDDPAECLGGVVDSVLCRASRTR